jgi:hypothetical protein
MASVLSKYKKADGLAPETLAPAVKPAAASVLVVK